ncbi:hypothetical protein [Anaerobacterium chartisolvens]|uniref:hypothetical protein n=1 Tax=Anaerobacterium chartisolvens TaxID=1297424 RepID=UPI000DF35F4E|nr:hypothetical protein [Anaerobacterium chartisolvens]
MKSEFNARKKKKTLKKEEIELLAWKPPWGRSCFFHSFPALPAPYTTKKEADLRPALNLSYLN